MKFFIYTLICLTTIYAKADSIPETHESTLEPTPTGTSMGNVETAQHHVEDTGLDTTYLQALHTSSHGGFYGLGFWGLGFHRARLAYQNYKDHSAQYGVVLGYGRTLENKRYAGTEIVYTRDLFDKHKGSSRFRRSNVYEIVGRYGRIIQANFLPYIRLGFGYQDYQYFADTRKTNFYGLLLTPGVGVQVFVKPQIFLRVETSYQWAIRARHKDVIMNRKPQGPNLWGGVGIVF